MQQRQPESSDDDKCILLTGGCLFVWVMAAEFAKDKYLASFSRKVCAGTFLGMVGGGISGWLGSAQLGATVATQVLSGVGGGLTLGFLCCAACCCAPCLCSHSEITTNEKEGLFSRSMSK